MRKLRPRTAADAARECGEAYFEANRKRDEWLAERAARAEAANNWESPANVELRKREEERQRAAEEAERTLSARRAEAAKRATAETQRVKAVQQHVEELSRRAWGAARNALDGMDLDDPTDAMETAVAAIQRAQAIERLRSTTLPEALQRRYPRTTIRAFGDLVR